MTSSYTTPTTRTFTITNAKYLASKVATDLKRMQRFYGYPSDAWITDFELEITQLLKYGILEEVYYGFQRDNKLIAPGLTYTANDFNAITTSNDTDNDPGKIQPGSNIHGATFYSHLKYSPAWHKLSDIEKEKIELALPILRKYGDELEINGYLEYDRIYSSSGVSLARASVKSFS